MASDDENEHTTTINFKPSFVLIAIDTHPSMFETRIVDESGNETHPFKDALTACYELADSLIFSSSRSNYNQFGVVLVDKDEKASLMEVESNFLDSVKLLKQKCSLSNEELQNGYERQGNLDLGAFFLLCKKKFKAINAAYYKRTIIFITTDDDPVEQDPQKRFTALNEAKTFEAGDITFELVTMTDKFDYTKFYNELFHLYTKPSLEEILCQDKDGLVDKLSNSIVFRYTKLRYNFYPFKNDHSRYLKVMKVNFIRKAKLYNTSKATRDGRLLKRVRDNLGVDNPNSCAFTLNMGASVEPLQLELKDKYDIYGNDLPLGLHLQYVSDRQTQPGFVVNETTILIVDPKEDLPYFGLFWQYCVDNDKVLICIKKYKHPTEIRYVELVPKYANDQRLFLIVDLPYCHELRLPKTLETAEPKTYETTEEQHKLVRQLIEELSVDYDPKMLLNPSLAKKKVYVKNRLLDELHEEAVDPTADTEGIDGQIGNIVGEIKRAYNWSDSQGTKRKAPPTRGRGRKAAK